MPLFVPPTYYPTSLIRAPELRERRAYLWLERAELYAREFKAPLLVFATDIGNGLKIGARNYIYIVTRWTIFQYLVRFVKSSKPLRIEATN